MSLHNSREQGVGIVVGARVEISPHFDLWMRGARFGVVRKIESSGIVVVKMDHPQVRKLQRFVNVNDLRLA